MSKINSSRIELFDIILNNKFFAIFFSAFCLLILINGSNFIDGLNGLLISSTIIILFMLTKLNLIDNSIISDQSINLNYINTFTTFVHLIFLMF